MNSVIVYCCLGMRFAVEQHLFRCKEDQAWFDSGEATVPRLLVAMRYCPWCGKEIGITNDR